MLRKFIHYFIDKGNKMEISNNKWFNQQVEEIYNEPKRHNTSKYHQQWTNLIKDNPEEMYMFYQNFIEFLDNVIKAKKKGDNTLDEYLLKFTDIFATFDPKTYDVKNITNEKGEQERVFISAFSHYSDTILEKIHTLSEFKNYDILPNDSLPFSDFTKIIVSLFEMSSYHTYFMDDTQKQKFAPFVLPFAQKVESRSTLFLKRILRHHENPIEQYVKVIFYGLAHQQEKEGIFTDLTCDMFFVGSDASDFEHKNAYKILQEFLKEKNTFSTQEAEFLLYHFFIYSLCIGEEEKEEPFEKRWITASKFVAKSSITKKSIELLLNKFPKCKYTDTLNKLLLDSIEIKNRPRVFEIKNQPTVIFKDFGLKLWIIDELMYKKEVLKPKLILDEFKEEYLKRQIGDDDGYEPIPEIKSYFKKLDIPLDLLATIEILEMDYGLGGGAEIIDNLWPFYDPGCGDEFIKVTNKAIDDLDKLPALKKIVGLEYSSPSNKLLKELKLRGIEVVDYQL